MDASWRELSEVLREARAWLALPGNRFDWSSWADSDAALREVDALIATLDADRLPNRLTIRVLFAPTGPIQEVSLSSGWADEFLALTERFDRAEKRAYDQGSWWWRLLNRRVTPV